MTEVTDSEVAMEPELIQPGADRLLISCLMVTLAVSHRLAYIKSSIASFTEQSYPHKELIVVPNGEDKAAMNILLDYLNSLGRHDIKVIKAQSYLSLGNLRNIAVENANGDVLCQWDDDDLYHPQRLSRQLQGLMQGAFEATYLQDVMQYVPRRRSLYWTNWRATVAGAHPGTLMARRTAPIRYPIDGEYANLGEDLQLALNLNRRGAVSKIGGLPHLYIYVSHGANSWNIEHHDMLTARLAISRGLLLRREAEIREGLSPFQFQPDGVSVQGSNGVAFEIQPVTG